jgi:hypothetical protein
MNLAKTDLPREVVSTLRRLNIREVETLLSMTATPRGLIAIAKALAQSEEEVRSLSRRLQHEHPEIEVLPAGGEAYPMGHLPPRR